MSRIASCGVESDWRARKREGRKLQREGAKRKWRRLLAGDIYASLDASLRIKSRLAPRRDGRVEAVGDSLPMSGRIPPHAVFVSVQRKEPSDVSVSEGLPFSTIESFVLEHRTTEVLDGGAGCCRSRLPPIPRYYTIRLQTIRVFCKEDASDNIVSTNSWPYRDDQTAVGRARR